MSRCPHISGYRTRSWGGYVLFDIFMVAYLRSVGKRDRVFDSWKKLHAEIVSSYMWDVGQTSLTLLTGWFHAAQKQVCRLVKRVQTIIVMCI